MNYKILTLALVTAIAIAVGGVAMPIMAEDDEQSAEEPEEVNLTVGESVSTGVHAASSSMENDFSATVRESVLNNAENDSARAEIASELIDESSEEAQELSSSYDEVVTAEEEGEINRGEMVREVAQMSNEVSEVQETLEDIQQVEEYVSEDELDDAGVDSEEIDEIEENLEIVGSDSVQSIGAGVLTQGSDVSMNAQQNGIEVAVEASNERVFHGLENAQQRQGGEEVNVSEEDAVDAAKEQVPDNVSEELKDVDMQRNNAYVVTFDDDSTTVDVRVDAQDGEIVGHTEQDSTSEQVPRNQSDEGAGGPPSWVDDGNDEDDEPGNDRGQGP